MSKLHVNQIAGYLSTNCDGRIPMADVAGLQDTEQKRKLFLSRALAAFAVAHLTGTNFDAVCAKVTDGQRDGGIDLIHFEETEKTLYLVQSKWHSEGHGSIDVGDMLKFLAGVKKLLDDDFASFNERIQQRQEEVQRATYDATAKIVLLLVHTGQEDIAAEPAGELRAYVDAQNDPSEIVFQRVLSQAELHKAVAAGVAGAPIRVEVQVLEWGQVREPYQSVYGQVNGDEIARWYEQHGTRLFAPNLRQFLGRTSVNDDIVATLLERPTDFWYFNNGITGISTQIAKKPVGGNTTNSGIFECDGFFVVNGAQTVGSIWEAWRKDPEKIGQARVPVRIISQEGGKPDFGTEITRFTNTQNSIEKRDFVALDAQQERLRQELAIEGVNYLYKSGGAKLDPKASFDLLEATLALSCASTDVSLAVQAKREIGKLWEDITKAPYRVLFNPSVTGPYLWDVVQLHRDIAAAVAATARHNTGRSALILVHGNRLTEWLTFKALQWAANRRYPEVKDHVMSAAASTADRVIAAVTEMFPDSYPASLFKNATKCKALASKLV